MDWQSDLAASFISLMARLIAPPAVSRAVNLLSGEQGAPDIAQYEHRDWPFHFVPLLRPTQVFETSINKYDPVYNILYRFPEDLPLPHSGWGKNTLKVLKDEATCQRLYSGSLHASSEEGLSCAVILREPPRALHCDSTSTDGKAEAQGTYRMFKASEHGSDSWNSDHQICVRAARVNPPCFPPPHPTLVGGALSDGGRSQGKLFGGKDLF